MSVVRKKMKGVSELIVIITILLVAVVAVFAFRAWVAGQQQRMGSIDMATASYSVQYSPPNTAIISLLVRNNLPSNISVANVTIVLSDGNILYPGYSGGGITVTPSSVSASVGAKSDLLITIRITGLTSSGMPIRDVNVLVQDPSTGQSQWIKAVGG